MRRDIPLVSAERPNHPRIIPKVRAEHRRELKPLDCDRAPPEELLRGIGQFNAGQYWECHETLERIWVREPDDIRYLDQGILLVGVGLLHLSRRNHHGAVTKLASGVDLLASFEPRCMRVEVSKLRQNAAELLDALAGGSEALDAALALPPLRCVVSAVSHLPPGR